MMQDTEVLGEVFPKGTVLSVPSYSIHHLEEVWGDPWTYRPERWLEDGNKDQYEKALNIFSYGSVPPSSSCTFGCANGPELSPRSCVGRKCVFHLHASYAQLTSVALLPSWSCRSLSRPSCTDTTSNCSNRIPNSRWRKASCASRLVAIWASGEERSPRGADDATCNEILFATAQITAIVALDICQRSGLPSSHVKICPRASSRFGACYAVCLNDGTGMHCIHVSGTDSVAE